MPLAKPNDNPYAAIVGTTVRTRIAIIAFQLPTLSLMSISELSEVYAAGLLIFPHDSENLMLLQNEEINIGSAVLLDCTYPQAAFPQLSRNFSAAAEEGTAYLLKNDHRRIALLLRKETAKEIQQQITEGYHAALSSVNAVFDHQLILSSSEDC